MERIALQSTCFNSRTREGCDFGVFCCAKCLAVSIHAPARGATHSTLPRCLLSRFQFTHPRGVRHRTRPLCQSLMAFQFTHPRGVRPRINLHTNILLSFNSRTREGCDTPPSPFVCASTAFQFTHLRGVRPFAPRLAARLVVSIHAPARGATKADDKPAKHKKFQFTHPRGVRHVIF